MEILGLKFNWNITRNVYTALYHYHLGGQNIVVMGEKEEEGGGRE